MNAAWIALLVGWLLGIATVGVLIGAGAGWTMIRDVLGAEPAEQGIGRRAAGRDAPDGRS